MTSKPGFTKKKSLKSQLSKKKVFYIAILYNFLDENPQRFQGEFVLMTVLIQSQYIYRVGTKRKLLSIPCVVHDFRNQNLPDRHLTNYCSRKLHLPNSFDKFRLFELGNNSTCMVA